MLTLSCGAKWIRMREGNEMKGRAEEQNSFNLTLYDYSSCLRLVSTLTACFNVDSLLNQTCVHLGRYNFLLLECANMLERRVFRNTVPSLYSQIIFVSVKQHCLFIDKTDNNYILIYDIFAIVCNHSLPFIRLVDAFGVEFNWFWCKKVFDKLSNLILIQNFSVDCHCW